MASIITFASYLLVFITLPISIWGCVKVIFYYVAKLEPTDHVLSLSAYSMPVSTGGSILCNTVKAKVENYKKIKTQVVQEYERAVIFRLGRYFDNILNWFSLLFLLKLFLKYKFSFLQSTFVINYLLQTAQWGSKRTWTVLCSAMHRHIQVGTGGHQHHQHYKRL